jgi:hypothetical protein
VTKIAKLRRLSASDWVLLGQLSVFCLAIAAALRLTRWQRVSDLIVSQSRSRLFRRLPLLQLGYSIEDLSPLVDMSSSIWPRNRCLVRSMVLLWLLRTRGQYAEVVLGVRKRSGGFEAHAWTESAQGPVGDEPESIEDFAVLTSSGRQEQL